MDKYRLEQNSKFYSFFCVLLMTLLLTSDLFAFKIIKLDYITVPAGSFLMPFWFLLIDMFAELYGYAATKKIIWLILICASIFSVLCYLLLLLPASPTSQLTQSYNIVLGSQPKIIIGNILGVVLGTFLNSYLIVKWKILLRGKYFYIRTIGSSVIGQFIFSAIAISIGLATSVGIEKLTLIIFVSFFIKLIILAIFGVPCAIITALIKKRDGIDTYDHNIEFNPFRI